MQVKKRTLYIICSIALLLVIGGIVYYKYSEKQAKVKALANSIERALDAYNREVEREYDRMKRQYEDYIETIKDSSYSLSFRERYIHKVYDLIGYQYSYGYDAFDVWNFSYEQQKHEKQDLEMLKLKATEKVQKSL
ncbi:MAG: hypothetical protein BHV69_10200 [Bacteroidales bacterium 52_46]|nr:MAG: hypothetical protein BHV69_10200 [Bacteroidales bacterium 52_46]